MRSKPTRKDPNKERIFSQRQNIQDFDYIKDHRGQVDGKNPKLSRIYPKILRMECVAGPVPRHPIRARGTHPPWGTPATARG